ncbi:Hypothetical predicted protein [Olea europaea subsp. europaea]|uniref:Uncharacterized protein n=1 Tax=Olea europaea subsp. europaea TaxID=158383 RepID=A0A8S0VPH7_OLEEU|nr:Hypothetical predicted protein [Olea europaea subsp. europaea]
MSTPDGLTKSIAKESTESSFQREDVIHKEDPYKDATTIELVKTHYYSPKLYPGHWVNNRPGGSSTGIGIDLGRGGGRKTIGTSIETIRAIYSGTEALILMPTQPLFVSFIHSPMEKRKK